MNQQRKLSRHNSRQSSIGETASVGSAKSGKSNGSSNDYSYSLSGSQLSANNNNSNGNNSKRPNGQLGKTKQYNSHESDTGSSSQPSSTSILNVAEMVLHGVADNEILDTWLRSINCEEFVSNFIDAGYDMPTISRITPQDLTAIGITEPSKRLKILSEIKKLNLQDGIPNFRPATLSHWLSLIRLESYYYKSLCDQNIDTIDKMCQLTWEDYEELGIFKLGHQKRLNLAVERLKGLEDETKNPASKPISEPIYDTNPSQILLVASAENHSMNGPIINKQSSTSELSSTGSGSMHSVYSANSTHYQQTYGTLPDCHQSTNSNNMQNGSIPQQYQQAQPQPIYGHVTPSMIYQQPSQLQFQQQQPNQQGPLQPNITTPGHNRQSMGQLPFSALANLPKHQQQLLQQSSIYATLSRQPGKVKPPPPPVPIRTNSLKTNSLIDEVADCQEAGNNLNNSHTTSTSSLFRSGTNTNNRCHYNSQTMLTKNKSFSGNAHMEASRARFLNRNSQQPQQQQYQFTQYLPQALTNQNCNANNQNIFYGMTNSNGYGAPPMQDDNIRSESGQFRHPSYNKKIEDLDLNADASSTKSLVIQPSTSALVSPSESNTNNGTSLDSGSSQTLYNSASSGSNEHSLNMYNATVHPGQPTNSTTASSCTLNDANLTLERQFRLSGNQPHPPLPPSGFSTTPVKNGAFMNNTSDCNATIGKDDYFPPPPSPSTFNDPDESDIVSLNSDANFAAIQHGLMTFKVGI